MCMITLIRQNIQMEISLMTPLNTTEKFSVCTVGLVVTVLYDITALWQHCALILIDWLCVRVHYALSTNTLRWVTLCACAQSAQIRGNQSIFQIWFCSTFLLTISSNCYSLTNLCTGLMLGVLLACFWNVCRALCDMISRTILNCHVYS